MSPRNMAEQLLIDRNGLVSAITAFLAGNDPRTLDGIQRALEREIDKAGPSALADLGERLANAGRTWSFFLLTPPSGSEKMPHSAGIVRRRLCTGLLSERDEPEDGQV